MIDSYTALQDAIADWRARSDLTAAIPTFIQNAEARLNKRVRHREMEASQDVTIDAAGAFALPADYQEARSLRIEGDPAAFPRQVEPTSAEFTHRFRPYSLPQFFAVLEGRVMVKPAAAGAGTFYYFAKLPALSDSNPTNWLLERSPECYLYAALVEAATWERDPEDVQTYAALLAEAVAGLLEDRKASRVPAAPAAPGAAQ